MEILKKIQNIFKPKYLTADEIIYDFWEGGRTGFKICPSVPVISYYGNATDVFLKDYDLLTSINPNLVIYNKNFIDKDTVEFFIKVGGNTWMPLRGTDLSGVNIRGLYFILNYIEDDINSEYKNNMLKNIKYIHLYVLNIPVTSNYDIIDILETDLVPKLIENNVEII